MAQKRTAESTGSGTAVAILAHGVMAVILFAGVAKLWDLSAFAHSLGSWTLIPGALIPPVVVLVPLAECVLGVLWFAGVGRRRVRILAVGLLSLFTLTYGAHVLFASTPECNCLGKILAFERSQHDAAIVLGRNALLLFGLAGGMIAAPRPRALARRSDVPSAPGPLAAKGFTLIETIIVIAIITILIALMAPSLGQVRQQVDDVTHIANLRSHGSILTMYLTDWEDTFPYYVDPKATTTVLRAPGAVIPINKYFMGYFFWHIALANQYLDGQWNSAAFLPRDINAELVTPYWYSATCIARPEFWNESTRTGPAQWRPVRAGQVTFPDAKGVFFASNEMFNTAMRPDTARPTVSVAFADGSARRIKRGRFTRAYPRGEGSWPGSVFSQGIPVMHTIDGVRGRDIR